MKAEGQSGSCLFMRLARGNTVTLRFVYPYTARDLLDVAQALIKFESTGGKAPPPQAPDPILAETDGKPRA